MRYIDCCKSTRKNKKCTRKDGKHFSLQRRFSKKKCIKGPVRGFTMTSSCAPYKFCKNKTRKKQRKKRKKKKLFLYNPDDPDKSFDVYIDKNPKDTIPIKYTTVKDVKNTIKKLERLYKTKKYSHKRIWQVGMIMKVRLEAMLKHKTKKYPNAKKVKQRFNLANKYFKFLGKRTKKKDFKSRKALSYKF